MNTYDLEHACAAHPLMSKETWTKVYADAWRQYYSDAHVETIMRRAVGSCSITATRMSKRSCGAP